MNTLDQFDDPTISDSLSSRADQEVVGSAFGDAMLDAVRTSTKKRRVHRRLAVGGASALTVAALAFTVVPGTSLLGNHEDRAVAPAAGQVPEFTSEADVLALQTGPLTVNEPQVRSSGSSEAVSEGGRLYMTYGDGRRVALPEGLTNASKVHEDKFGSILIGDHVPVGGSKAPVPNKDTDLLTMLVPAGSTTPQTFRSDTEAFKGQLSPDLQRMTLNRVDGTIVVVDRATGAIDTNLLKASACAPGESPWTVAWTRAGIITACRDDKAADKVPVHLTDASTGNVIRSWTQKWDDIDWYGGPDANTLVQRIGRNQLVAVDAHSGATIATSPAHDVAASPVLSPDGTRVVLGSMILETTTMKVMGTLPFPARTTFWNWRSDGWLLGEVTTRDGASGKKHFYWVECTRDLKTCYRLETDPTKESTTSEPVITSGPRASTS